MSGKARSHVVHLFNTATSSASGVQKRCEKTGTPEQYSNDNVGLNLGISLARHGVRDEVEIVARTTAGHAWRCIVLRTWAASEVANTWATSTTPDPNVYEQLRPHGAASIAFRLQDFCCHALLNLALVAPCRHIAAHARRVNDRTRWRPARGIPEGTWSATLHARALGPSNESNRRTRTRYNTRAGSHAQGPVDDERPAPSLPAAAHGLVE